MTMPDAYAAIKGRIISLTRYIATYYACHNIRANAISPGGIFNDQDRKFVEQYRKRTPLDRMADPEEIVGPVMFLMSDAASYMTGSNLIVDGGLTAW